MSLTYAEITVGRELVTYARTVTEADLVAFTCFAGLKLPIFVDAEFARTQSAYGERIVPGFLTCSIVGGMMEGVLGPSTVGALGMDEVRFPRPVKPGDTIHARITVDEKRDLKDGRRGLVAMTVRAFNQTGAQVLHLKNKAILWREPPASGLPEPIVEI